MNFEGGDTLNVEGLDRLVKALKRKPPLCHVGILGSSERKPKEGDKSVKSNAEVGAVHEFGAPARGIPQRSFLRVPISERLEKEMVSLNLMTTEKLKQVIKTGSLVPWMREVANAAVFVVMDAFQTGGFGKWPSWKGKNYTNNTGQLLKDTLQLRDSITSEVKEQ